jgi:hypothetical protein
VGTTVLNKTLDDAAPDPARGSRVVAADRAWKESNDPDEDAKLDRIE